MRIAVIGAGIVGVTTAFELSFDGHEVTVFERCGSVAAEGSFANAGVLAPGYVTPLAAPGMPRQLLRHCLNRRAPLHWAGHPGPGGAAWLWKWLRSCRSDTYLHNRGRMHRLAVAGRVRRRLLTRVLRLDHEHATGYTVLLRSAEDLALARSGLQVLQELGVRFELLDADACRQLEPGLNPAMPLHAGIHLIDDEVANCRQFSHLMRQEAQKLGARFRFHATVLGIDAGAKPALRYLQKLPQEPGRIAATAPGARNEPASELFDAIVVCAALDSRTLLAPHGLQLPLLAVHGYSITAPMRHDHGETDLGPRSGVMDERYKVAISRIGDRIRVSGGAEIGGSMTRNSDKALQKLHDVLNDWYPGVARLNQAQVWKGARPMLPDGPPVIGASGIPGIWLNLGHGSSGWAMANGSARLLADLVGGQPPSIDPEGLGVDRLLS
ncbi:FAD-dependent oxidoreductase [Piscinibacter sakaiensis]|uniref:FAD-dependent oxidoreductase n=1 Tax=Piscinibacter sakaiensis TaxID=1547922 RepID=UPI003AAE2010